jgi:tetratricopeptide (TPR) repeat protein
MSIDQHLFREEWKMKMTRSGKKWLQVLLALAMLSLPGITQAEDQPRLIEESVVLSGDWEEIVRLVEEDNSLLQSPVNRIVLGHACLATNRNDSSFGLFDLSMSAAALDQYSRWAGDIAERHPESALAGYFRGDALARGGDFDSAVATFQSAMTRAEGNTHMHALLINARGVANLARGQADAAGDDFFEANELYPELADPAANLAGRCLLLSDGAEGGYEMADLALEGADPFVFAHITRACLAIVLGRKEEGEADLMTDLESELGIFRAEQNLERSIEVTLRAQLAEIEEGNLGNWAENLATRYNLFLNDMALGSNYLDQQKLNREERRNAREFGGESVENSKGFGMEFSKDGLSVNNGSSFKVNGSPEQRQIGLAEQKATIRSQILDLKREEDGLIQYRQGLQKKLETGNGGVSTRAQRNPYDAIEWGFATEFGLRYSSYEAMLDAIAEKEGSEL